MEKVERNFKVSAYNSAAFQLDAYDLNQSKAEWFFPLFRSLGIRHSGVNRGYD